ncbi:MAG: cation:proton antiporter [Thermoplasmatota archaeon]
MDGEGALIVTDFAIVMGTAALVALLFHKLRLPLLPGYLLAGVILSTMSSRWGLVRELASIDLMSQLGMTLLFFTIGMRFNLRRLREYGALIIFIGCVEILMCLAGGYWLGTLLGWTRAEAAALGGMVAISSSVMVFRQLSSSGRDNMPRADLIMGILIVEDVAAVMLITLFSTMEAGVSLELMDLSLTALKIVLFVVFAVAIGVFVLPRAVDRVTATHSTEILTLTALGLCFAMAGLAEILGFSPSTGAFVMGVIVGEARSVRAVESRLSTVRDFFIALFFITIGFYVTLDELWAALPLGLAVTGAFIGLNFLSVSFACMLGGRSLVGALSVALSMLAMGEFSLVIATTALASGMVHQPLPAIAIIASLITTALLPQMVRLGDAVVERLRPASSSELGFCCSPTANWVEKLKSRARVNPELERATGDFIRSMVTSGLIIAGVVLAVGWLMQRSDWVSSVTGAGAPYVQLAVLVLAFVMLLVQAVVMARRIQTYLEMVSSVVMRTSASARVLGKGLVRRILRNVAAASLAVLLMALLTFLLPASSVWRTVFGVGALALIVAAAYFIENSLTRLHQRLEALFQGPGGVAERTKTAILEEVSDGVERPLRSERSGGRRI